MRILRGLTILCGAVLLASCGESTIGPLIHLEEVRSINGFYSLESFTVAGIPFDVTSGRSVTLNLNSVDRTDLTGTGPCNDFFGDYSHTDNRLVITDWVTTDLDCPSEQAMALEAALFDALLQDLEAVVDLDQSPARLVMTGGETIIVWVEGLRPATQPTRPLPSNATTTSIPGGSDTGEIEA